MKLKRILAGMLTGIMVLQAGIPSVTATTIPETETSHIELEEQQYVEETENSESSENSESFEETEQSTEYPQDYSELEELIDSVLSTEVAEEETEEATEEATEETADTETTEERGAIDAVKLDGLDTVEGTMIGGVWYPWTVIGTGIRVVIVDDGDGGKLIYEIDFNTEQTLMEQIAVAEQMVKADPAATYVIVKCDDEGIVEKLTSADSFALVGETLILKYDKEKTAEKEAKKLDKNDSIEFAEVSQEFDASGTAESSTGEEVTGSEDDFAVKVAILDTGVVLADNCLVGRIVDTGLNFTNNSMGDSIYDDNGHGTVMAEIVAKNTPESVGIVPIKIADGSGTASTVSAYLGVLAAIELGVDVINISMNAKSSELSASFEYAIECAKDAGIEVVVSAGNLASDVKTITPSNLEAPIVVSAVNGEKKLASYSNYGDTIDYCAYGYYEGNNGTSQAAARVSAFVAKAISEGKEPVKELDDYAEDLGDKKKYGKGFVDLHDTLPELMGEDINPFEIDWKSLTETQLEALVEALELKVLGKFLFELSEEDKELIKDMCPALLKEYTVCLPDGTVLDGTLFENAIAAYTLAMNNEEFTVSNRYFASKSGYWYFGIVGDGAGDDIGGDPYDGYSAIKVNVSVMNNITKPQISGFRWFNELTVKIPEIGIDGNNHKIKLMGIDYDGTGKEDPIDWSGGAMLDAGSNEIAGDIERHGKVKSQYTGYKITNGTTSAKTFLHPAQSRHSEGVNHDSGMFYQDFRNTFQRAMIGFTFELEKGYSFQEKVIRKVLDTSTTFNLFNREFMDAYDDKTTHENNMFALMGLYDQESGESEFFPTGNSCWIDVNVNGNAGMGETYENDGTDDDPDETAHSAYILLVEPTDKKVRYNVYGGEITKSEFPVAKIQDVMYGTSDYTIDASGDLLDTNRYSMGLIENTLGWEQDTSLGADEDYFTFKFKDDEEGTVSEEIYPLKHIRSVVPELGFELPGYQLPEGEEWYYEIDGKRYYVSAKQVLAWENEGYSNADSELYAALWNAANDSVLKLYANWEPTEEKAEVKYSKNGGSAGEDFREALVRSNSSEPWVLEGSTRTKIKAFSKTGFKGPVQKLAFNAVSISDLGLSGYPTTNSGTKSWTHWGVKTGCKSNETKYEDEVKYDKFELGNGDRITLYAHWKNRTVTLPSPGSYSKAFVFLGWSNTSTNVEVAQAVYGQNNALLGLQPGDKYELESAATYKGSEETLYPVWQRNLYRITYDYSTNGGTNSSGAATATQDVLYNKAVGSLKTDAVKKGDTGVYSASNPDGWQFIGWNTDKNATEGFTTVETFFTNGLMPAKDVTLYAIYKKTITATFIDYEYSGSGYYVDLGDAQRKTQKASATVYNNNTTAEFTAGNHNVTGWSFIGWVEASKAKEAFATGNYVHGIAIKCPVTLNEDTTFYGSYSRVITWYYAQQLKDIKRTGIIYRNSYSINKYTRTVKDTAEKQDIKIDWEPIGWTLSLDCTATPICKGGEVLQAIDGGVYFGLYEQDITVEYDSNGYTPVGDMPKPETKKAYYTTAAWDRTNSAANKAHQLVKNNNNLAARGYVVGNTASGFKTSAGKGYSFPVFTTAPAISVFRKNNEKETDVVFKIWSIEKEGSLIDRAQFRDDHYLRPDDFFKQINWTPVIVYEAREDTILYGQYKTVEPPPGDRIDISISILVGDEYDISESFKSDLFSDTGRVYKTRDNKIARVAQDGVVTGVNDGIVIVDVYTSDGKTQLGTCTVIVSTCAVTVPKMLPLGSNADVGITIRASKGAKITGSLTMEALSGLRGESTDSSYQLHASIAENKSSRYKEISEGAVVVTATADGTKVTKKVLFKVDPNIAFEQLPKDYYTATIVWKLDLRLE